MLALFQCDFSVGQYTIGQVRFVDCSSYGDRTDENTEGEDRSVFFDFMVGAVDEAGQHGEAFLYLAAVERRSAIGHANSNACSERGSSTRLVRAATSSARLSTRYGCR